MITHIEAYKRDRIMCKTLNWIAVVMCIPFLMFLVSFAIGRVYLPFLGLVIGGMVLMLLVVLFSIIMNIIDGK